MIRPLRYAALHVVPLALVVAAAGLFWSAFRPGLFSADSVHQIEMARAREYSDVHPPIMSVAMTAVLACGGTPGLLVLAQCLAVALGVFTLARAVVAVVARGPTALESWVAAAVTLTLLLPVSPLGVHLVTFWKDVWVLGALCWVLSRAMRLWENPRSPVNAAVMFAAMTVALLARHNAIVLLPGFCALTLAVFFRSGSWRRRAAVACAPALLYLAAHHGIRVGFHVEHSTLFDSMVKQIELVECCAAKPDLIAALPAAQRYLKPDFAARRLPGCGFRSWEACWNDDLIRAERAGFNQQLDRDYRYVVTHDPGMIARVKWDAFMYHFRANPCAKFQAVTFPMRPGLEAHPATASVRDSYVRHLDHAFAKPAKRWLFTRHSVWLVINLVGVIGCAGAYLRTRRRTAAFLALILLTPLPYTASYLAVSVASDFRYVYPASLVMQVIALSAVSAAGVVWLSRFVPAATQSAHLRPASAVPTPPVVVTPAP